MNNNEISHDLGTPRDFHLLQFINNPLLNFNFKNIIKNDIKIQIKNIIIYSKLI